MTRENALIVDFPPKPRTRNASIGAYHDGATCEVSFLRHRSVCFLPIRYTHYIGSRSEEEIHATWYSNKERKRFKRDTLREAAKLREILIKTPSEKFLSEDDECLCTGLEFHFSAELKDMVHEKRMKHRYAVLKEQEKQFNSRAEDADELARVSWKMSRWARKTALEIGKMSLNQKRL